MISFNGVNYHNNGSKVENISEEEYQALVQAGEVDPNTIYFRYDGETSFPPVQNDGNATSLIDESIPTGKTIESVLNSNFVKLGLLTQPQNVYSAAAYGAAYKLFDKFIIVIFKANIASSIGGSGATLCTLPEGFRPQTVVKRSVFTTYNSSTNYFDVNINPDGTITTAIGSGTLTVMVTIPSVVFTI